VSAVRSVTGGVDTASGSRPEELDGDSSDHRVPERFDEQGGTDPQQGAGDGTEQRCEEAASVPSQRATVHREPRQHAEQRRKEAVSPQSSIAPGAPSSRVVLQQLGEPGLRGFAARPHDRGDELGRGRTDRDAV